MKLLTCALLLCLSTVAMGQERIVGIALERFGIVAGAWWLNKKCKILGAEEEARFNRDVAVINVSLATSINNQNLVLSIQNSGKKVAESGKYDSCNAEAKGIVQYSVSAARQWSNEIRRAVLETATKLPGAPH